MVVRAALPEEQQLFARLSVFAGGCTLEAAEEVAEADLDTLQSLVEKSLARFTDGRYWMLETIREYGAERLRDTGEMGLLAERLTDQLVELAYMHGAPRFRQGAAEAFERLDREHGNVRALMEWAEREEQPLLAAEIVAVWALVWVIRGHLTESSGWVPLALRARGRLPSTCGRSSCWAASTSFSSEGPTLIRRTC